MSPRKYEQTKDPILQDHSPPVEERITNVTTAPPSATAILVIEQVDVSTVEPTGEANISPLPSPIQSEKKSKKRKKKKRKRVQAASKTNEVTPPPIGKVPRYIEHYLQLKDVNTNWYTCEELVDLYKIKDLLCHLEFHIPEDLDIEDVAAALELRVLEEYSAELELLTVKVYKIMRKVHLIFELVTHTQLVELAISSQLSFKIFWIDFDTDEWCEYLEARYRHLDAEVNDF